MKSKNMFFEANIKISLSLPHPFSFRLSNLVQWSKLGTPIKRDMKMQGFFGFLIHSLWSFHVKILHSIFKLQKFLLPFYLSFLN